MYMYICNKREIHLCPHHSVIFVIYFHGFSAVKRSGNFSLYFRETFDGTMNNFKYFFSDQFDGNSLRWSYNEV